MAGGQPVSVETTSLRATTVGWQPGDPVGRRRFAALGDLVLESGVVLPDVTLAYETWGTFRGTNAVLVLHALTGDAHAAGDAEAGHPTPGWWNPLIGPGKPIDSERYFVVAANILGGCQGSTGPSSPAPDGVPWGSRFPTLTVRDQVQAELRLAEFLGVTTWHTVIGGSAGGMRALEWAIAAPRKVQRLLVIATTAWASAEQIALTETQAAAIRNDAAFRGGDYYRHADAPVRGLDVARRMAQISYRSERGRGGVATALGRITARTIVAAIDSDRLYPLFQQQQLSELIPRCRRLDVVNSLHGHDGFLIEYDQIGVLVDRLLG